MDEAEYLMKNYGDLGGPIRLGPNSPFPLLTPTTQAISRWAQLVSLFAKAFSLTSFEVKIRLNKAFKFFDFLQKRKGETSR